MVATSKELGIQVLILATRGPLRLSAAFMTQARVGVVGGGQLGRMLALAGIPMGISFRFFVPDDASPVAGLGEVCSRPWQDLEAAGEFAQGLDVCTFEIENVPVQTAQMLGELVPLRPSPRSLATGRDRWAEKQLFERLSIPTPAWVAVSERAELAAALERLGLPLMLKTRRLGYDGRGVALVTLEADLEPAWERLGEVPVVAESRVPFERELSILAVRASDGSEAIYPVVENQHQDGILRLTKAPAPDLPPRLARMAQDAVTGIVRDLGHVGVLALEMFQHGDRLLANEIAPRVHNTGHWTIEAAETSQFENHLRAALGLPLGSTAQTVPALMLNLLGEVPPASSLLLEGVHLHDYGKSARQLRKVGHLTVTAPDQEQLAWRVERLERALPH